MLRRISVVNTVNNPMSETTHRFIGKEKTTISSPRKLI